MEFDNIIFIFFLSILFNYILIKNNNFFFLRKITDTEFKKPQAFHKFPAIRSGGLTIIFFLMIFITFYDGKNNYLFCMLLLSLFFFIIGFLEDLKVNVKPEIRLFFLIILSFSTIYYFNIQVLNTQVQFLNNIIYHNKIFSVIFVCLCLLFIVNGCNFIDGFNGLLILHAIIILGTLYYVNSFGSNSLYLKNLILFFILILLSILFFNFPKAKIFLGDSGAYIIGVTLSLITIQVSNLNPIISPFFFSVLLFYIFFEVIFSFFRKILIGGVSPLKPDNKHLHMLVFKCLNYKVINKSKANALTSFIINSVYLIIILPSIYYRNDTFFCKTFFFFLIIFYLLCYFFFEKKSLKNI
jgi:UDP-N-acetylmuramyl pentapeptide phosphotransferase/UDP-N-acetylglucosamine-1-phosphate transferase